MVDTDAKHKDSSTVSLSAIVVWLGVQLLALLLSVARVPFWAHSVEPADVMAVDVMIITQLACLAFLFPFLLRNWRTTAAVILTAVPFVLMAGLLAGTDGQRLTGVLLALIAWTVALWMGIPLVRDSRRSTMLAVAIVACVTLGGPLLVYLQLESGTTPRLDWSRVQFFGPIMSAEALLHASKLTPLPHVVPAIAIGVIALSRIARRVAAK